MTRLSLGECGVIRVLVTSGYGINCQEELAAAWQLSGAIPEIVHFNHIFDGTRKLDEFDVFCLPGGFSFGDDLGSGNVLAGRIRYRQLPDKRMFFDELVDFISSGGFVIGICNGFQTLARLGLLPNLRGDYQQEITLAPNISGRFENRWVRLGAPDNAVNKHGWLRQVSSIELPVRHGEGRLLCQDSDIRNGLHEKGLILWQYLDEKLEPTSEYPYNPNGSEEQTAAISDISGQVIGMMPHPEAYLHHFMHPCSRRSRHNELSGDTVCNEDTSGDGLRFFTAITEHIQRSRR